MRLDCIRVSQSLQPQQVESARFGFSPFIRATWKGRAPFRLWCLDLVTRLEPPGTLGESTMVVAVCPFSKWGEAAPLLDKSSSTVASWFLLQLVSRYGVPWGVRVDQGKEFRGDF